MMVVPLEQVGRTGRLAITFAGEAGKTTIRESYGEVPFKVTRLFHPEGSSLAQAVLMHTTAGLFGGDCTDLAIHVERGSRVAVTSQSSLKVHPRNEETARQRIYLKVEDGGELHFYNDPLIPFANSRLDQRIQIELGAAARYFSWDGFMAGRIARGEAWKFASLASETRFSVGGKLVHLDRFQIEPSIAAPTRRWSMSNGRYFGTGLFFDLQMDPGLCVELHEKMPDAGVDQPIHGLVIVRVATGTASAFHAIRHYLANRFAQSVIRSW